MIYVNGLLYGFRYNKLHVQLQHKDKFALNAVFTRTRKSERSHISCLHRTLVYLADRNVKLSVSSAA